MELTLPTESGGLLNFLRQWRAWRRQKLRVHPLHYVLLLPAPPDLRALSQSLSFSASASLPQLQVLQRQLVRQFNRLGNTWVPGFQRLELDKGKVLLTVCIGPLKAMLKAQNFVADAVLVSGTDLTSASGEWDRWTAKALAQRCQPGCRVRLMQAAHGVAALLNAAGFSFEERPSSAVWRGRFAPRWAVKPPANPATRVRPTPTTCLVIGKGLAGAATAAALARRGWQVQVLDGSAAGKDATTGTVEGASTGASHLPLALFCPHVSKNDAPLSRLVRAGISLLTQRLPQLPKTLKPGRDWALTGAMQTLFEPAFAGANPATATGKTWHTQAGWVKPQALIEALLATPGVQVHPAAQVHALAFGQGLWRANDARGQCLGQAHVVVLATAGGTAKLLASLPLAALAALAALEEAPANRARLASLHPVHGQISWAYHDAGDTALLPRHPVNGYGHLSAHIPHQRRRTWYVGATYETAAVPETKPLRTDEVATVFTAHQLNFQRLKTLAPELASHLADRFATGNLQSWRGTRFATRDRLPLVGPLLNNPQTGLWLNTGLGSRGLSWCLLNAEILAAQLGGEPLPIDAQLAAKLAL